MQASVGSEWWIAAGMLFKQLALLRVLLEPTRMLLNSTQNRLIVGAHKCR